MATSQPATGFTLRLERTIAAPPEKVFEAWIRPEALTRWFGPSPEYTVAVLGLDARPGGRYRVQMHHSGGATHTVAGEYREVTPPQRLCFTWAWEDNAAFGESLVTVILEPAGTGCHVVLLQEQLPSIEAREAHTQGWNGCLDNLLRQF